MDLLILTVCVVGFLIIYGKDKIDIAEYDARKQRDIQSESRFVSRVSDPKVYWHINDMFGGDADRDKREWIEMCNEVVSAYHEMGWGEPNLSILIHQPHAIMMRILLANRGQLCEDDAKSGLWFNPTRYMTKRGNTSPFPHVLQISRSDWFSRQIRSDKQLGHYIIKKLRENGVSDEAFFVPFPFDYQQKCPERSRIYRFGTEPDTIGGFLMFYPAIPESNRKYIV